MKITAVAKYEPAYGSVSKLEVIENIRADKKAETKYCKRLFVLSQTVNLQLKMDAKCALLKFLWLQGEKTCVREWNLCRRDIYIHAGAGGKSFFKTSILTS